MSGIVAVVPMRGAGSAKTRLAPLFVPRERALLAWAMLAHVLDAIASSGAVDHTIIITREPESVRDRVGLGPGRSILPQPPHHPGLNAALDAARDWALARGDAAMLVLPADLPALAPGDVRTMARPGAQVVLAPDRHGAGTNALLLRLDVGGAFQFAFGPSSFHDHALEARRLGLPCETILADGLARDLDTPDDWLDLPEAVRTRLLAVIGLPARAMP